MGFNRSYRERRAVEQTKFCVPGKHSFRSSVEDRHNHCPDHPNPQCLYCRTDLDLNDQGNLTVDISDDIAVND